MDTKPRLIFLCAGNSISSQMAEALMKKYAGDRFEVYSAGIFSKKINPLTHLVMEEVGISLDEYRSKSINEFRGKYQFKYIFTVCEHSAKLFPRSFLSQGEHVSWDFENPGVMRGSEQEKIKKFREVRDQIDAQIKIWLEENPAKSP